MKKFLILVLGLLFIAASCDITGGVFDFGPSGARGVMKSDDGGESYAVSDKLVKTGDISNVTANALVFDPSNSSTLYIGSSSGMFKSTDQAKTWQFILSGIAVASVSVDALNPNTVYASGVVGSNGKIIKSVDGGTSWVDVYTEPSKNNPVFSVAVAPTNDSIVLAGLATGEIIRSLDSGHTWQTTKTFSDRVTEIKFAPSGAVYALTLHKGLEKSSDKGLTWNSLPIAINPDNTSLSPNSSAVTAFYDLGLDSRQPGVLYLGTEQGLFRSVNDGTSWVALSLPTKSASLRASAVTVNPSNSNNLYTAMASTIFKSMNAGLTWETKIISTGAEVRSILLDPQMNNLIYLGLGVTR